MKKKALLFVTLIAISTALLAQDNKLRFGLTAFPTVNVFKPDVDALEKTKNGLGFSYGLLTDFGFGTNYSFSSGLIISSYRGTLTYKDVAFHDPNNKSNFDNNATTTADYTLKYIDLPLTLKLRTNEIGYMTYYGQFGLGLGINIKATQDTETKYGTGNQVLTAETVNISDDIKLFRASLIVGAGIEYSISGSTAIQVGLTFNNGFSNILNGEIPEFESDGKIKVDSNNEIVNSSKKRSATNKVFALNLGIFF